jgi:thiol-disulfide isomerase/thioredoxin
MLSRRVILIVALIVGALAHAPAFAASPVPFNAQSFADAQKAGRPILVAIHATWCPTCKAQAPIVSQLTDDQKFNKLVYFVIDFDSRKDLVRRFGARMQSTLIVFKGNMEEGRSVGDTTPASIAALLSKAF